MDSDSIISAMHLSRARHHEQRHQVNMWWRCRRQTLARGWEIPPGAKGILAARRMQSPCYLPLELVDRIIDHLHDSPSDLRNCARVAKAFLPSSRLHLFYSISIDIYKILHRIVALNSIIQQSPQIALCIRELRDIASHDVVPLIR